MLAIEIKNLFVEFECRPVIHNFSMAVSPGEFTVLLGENGAGKSTLLKAILNLVKLKQGEILLFGKCYDKHKIPVGYVPQFYSCVNNHYLSAKSWLMAHSSGVQFGFPLLNKYAKERIDFFLHLVEAEHYADKPFVQLSGGEKQRLLLAQALLNDPKILLLDEPLNHLDLTHQTKLIELVENLRRSLGITLLMTTHHSTALKKSNIKTINLT